jgi:hypothetical protein
VSGLPRFAKYMKPLRETDFAAIVAEKRIQPDLFGEECGGFCGV